MTSHIDLQGVSVRFWLHQSRSSGLKELVMRKLRPPAWQKNAPPGKSEFWGLKDVNLSIREGDRLGIIGHNGAGKSTLLKVISRIYKPTQGKLTVRGRLAPLLELGAGFNPELSGRENIVLNASILGISRRVILDRIEPILEFSKLTEFGDVPVKYYSTGMYMRLAFTIATEIPPDILILDELFAGGDASFIEAAQLRLKNFIAQSKILIVVAHNLEYIEDLCSRILVLDHGQIVFEGTPKESIPRYLAHMHGDKDAFKR